MPTTLLIPPSILKPSYGPANCIGQSEAGWIKVRELKFLGMKRNLRNRPAGDPFIDINSNLMKSLLRSFFDKGTIKYAEYLNVCSTIWMVNSSVEDKMFVCIDFCMPISNFFLLNQSTEKIRRRKVIQETKPKMFNSTFSLWCYSSGFLRWLKQSRNKLTGPGQLWWLEYVA